MLKFELDVLAEKYSLNCKVAKIESEPWHTLIVVSGDINNILAFKNEFYEQYECVKGETVTVAVF